MTEDPVPRRILIVRPSALGDVCRTVPAIRTLRKAWPEAEIDVLLQEACGDALRHHPDIHEVIPFPRRSLSGWRAIFRLPGVLREWRRAFRRRDYDLVLDLQGLARSGLMTWLTRAPRRIGFRNSREFAWLGYNHRHRADAALHHVDRILALLAAEGLESDHDVRLYVGADDDKWLDSYLENHGGKDVRYACLAPTSRWQCKAWPWERFAEIGKRLLAGDHFDRLVILAGPNERDYLDPLIDFLRNESGRDDAVLVPETTVGQFLALISRCGLMVCNDSAPLHAAVGFERPIVTIFGPTDPALVGPYQRPESVVRPDGDEGLGSIGFYRRQKDDQSLISQVPVEPVWERVLEQIGECGVKPPHSMTP